MEEIVIDEKKYISSKRAAKETGYAKDYVGQLCREGRVQARLVGRAWYVLESAIYDHRFGSNVDSRKTNEATAETLPNHSMWESPRYSSVEDVVLPLRKKEAWGIQVKPSAAAAIEMSPQGEEKWETWFDMMSVAPDLVSPVTSRPEVNNESVQETSISIGTFRNRQQDAESLEQPTQKRETSYKVRQNSSSSSLVRVIRLLSMLVAVIFVTAALLNSGVFDRYLISFKQVNPFAGVSTYIKAR